MFSSTLANAALVLSLLAPTISGLPTAEPTWGGDKGGASLSKLKMPSSSLPAPESSKELKYVVLGIGTQNYTCASSDALAIPAGNGAIATLYDIGTSLSKDPLAQWKIPTISGLALALTPYPKQLDGYLKIQGYQKIMGEHFFNAVKTPVFSFSKVTPLPFPEAQVKRNASVDAPANACPGLKKEGAVQWLYLDDAGGSHGGINSVYRLETAGGSPPKNCSSLAPSFSVHYVAQYWVWGPKA
jgi:hypothetical protein